MKNHVSIENSPDFETAVEFTYPVEQLPPDIIESIEKYTSEIIHLKLTEAIRRLLLLLEREKNPQITLQALLLSVGVNPTDSNGTMTYVANTLHISRQRLHYQVKKMPVRLQRKIKEIKKNDNNPYKN